MFAIIATCKVMRASLMTIRSVLLVTYCVAYTLVYIPTSVLTVFLKAISNVFFRVPKEILFVASLLYCFPQVHCFAVLHSATAAVEESTAAVAAASAAAAGVVAVEALSNMAPPFEPVKRFNENPVAQWLSERIDANKVVVKIIDKLRLQRALQSESILHDDAVHYQPGLKPRKKYKDAKKKTKKLGRMASAWVNDNSLKRFLLQTYLMHVLSWNCLISIFHQFRRFNSMELGEYVDDVLKRNSITDLYLAALFIDFNYGNGLFGELSKEIDKLPPFHQNYQDPYFTFINNFNRYEDIDAFCSDEAKATRRQFYAFDDNTIYSQNCLRAILRRFLLTAKFSSLREKERSAICFEKRETRGLQLDLTEPKVCLCSGIGQGA